MRPAAELHRNARHLDHPHHVAVFFAEERRGALGDGRVIGQLPRDDLVVLPDTLVDDVLDPLQLALLDLPEMAVVKPQPLRADERPRLLDVLAQDCLERRVKQVGGAVVCLGHPARPVVDGKRYRIADGDLSLFYHAPVGDDVVGRPRGVGNLDEEAVGRYRARVSHLAAHLAVKRGLLGHDLDLVTGTGRYSPPCRRRRLP